MYKNFTLTESEREQILEQHKTHGYGKPLNEQFDDEFEDMVPDKEIDMEDSFIKVLEYYSAAQVIDAMVKYYEGTSEKGTARHLKSCSDYLRSKMY